MLDMKLIFTEGRKGREVFLVPIRVNSWFALSSLPSVHPETFPPSDFWLLAFGFLHSNKS